MGPGGDLSHMSLAEAKQAAYDELVEALSSGCLQDVEPEAAVVGKMNLRDSFRQHDGKQRKARRLFETASKLPAEFPRTRIRDRRQKIASCRKQPSQPFRDSRWQLLRILFIDEEANHLNNLRQNEQLS